MRSIFTIIVLLQAFSIHAQVWRPLATAPSVAAPSDKNIIRFSSFVLDKQAFHLGAVPHRSTLANMTQSAAQAELPLADGRYERFLLAEVSTLSPESALLYPEIKTYDLLSVDGSISGRLTYSPMGVNALLMTPEGRQYVVPADGSSNSHIVYNAKDYNRDGATMRCGADDLPRTEKDFKLKTTAPLGDCLLRTYDFAVAATGEFTTLLGGQVNAVASIVATMANVSLIFERDLGIKFSLVVNNSVIFTNATTDPYPTVGFPTVAVLDTNTATLNTVIGTSNYDLGMVFNDGWNGGIAYTPAVCNNLHKGGSAVGVMGSPFGSVMEGLVAHEIGHLFNANHTMAAGTGTGCSGNLNLPTAYEIGGGSTVMSYAGAVCSGLFYQNSTDHYFHFNSVSVIRQHAQTVATCAVTTATANTAPVLSVPAASYTVPISTPFELTANGSDVNSGNTLTYSFEQYDAGAAVMTAPPATNATTGPMFRSYPPSTANTRIFPALSFILSNTTSPWEVLPSVARTMNFRVLVRDNNAGNGCVAQESIAVSTNSAAGPFIVTSQNAPASFTANGVNTMTISWNVANSNAAPVNASAVNIYFSTDNGQTFPHLLAGNVPNNGTATVVVPNLNTTQGRIKVKAANNIFFDINNAPIAISSACLANGTSIVPDAAVTATQGSPTLNLNLAPVYGAPITISGTLSATDPASSLAVTNMSGSTCFNATGNPIRYDLYAFQVNVAGSYTFNLSTATPFGTMMTLYSNSFSPSSPCTNFITSNGDFNGSVINISNSISAVLAPGVNYVIAIGTFNASLPSLPAAYAVSVTTPTGGNIFSGPPNPGTTYTYRYVVVNNTTGNIVSITTTPNLSSYVAGLYTVYGASISNSVLPATLNAYVGLSYSSFQAALLNGTICGNVSGNAILVNINAPLQLNDLQLTASAVDNEARLQWRIANEDQIQAYYLERSADGTIFQTRAMVPASKLASYSYADKEPLAGRNHYRIRAVAANGSLSFSNIATVRFGEVGTASVLVLPNPTQSQAAVRFWKDATYECVLTDISGQVVQSFRVHGTVFTLDMGNLAAGVYLLRCDSGDERTVTRIVKQ